MQETGNRIMTKHPRLVIRVGGDSLSFSTLVPATEQQVAFEPYTVRSGMSMAANLREAFKTGNTRERAGQRAMVLVDSPVLMVPIEEYSESEQEVQYRHTITGHANDVVLAQVIPALNAVAVFSINKDLKLVVDDHFSDAKYGHVCTSVWAALHRRSFNGARQKLYGYFHDKKLEIVAFQKNRFKFCNSYSTTRVQDAVYFLLSVWKMLNMDQNKDELHIVGNIPEKETMLEELRKFLHNVYAINPTADLNRAPITQIKGFPYDLITHFVRSIH